MSVIAPGSACRRRDRSHSSRGPSFTSWLYARREFPRAALAAVVAAHLELRLAFDLLHPRPLRHPASLLVDCDGGFAPEAHPQLAQQRLSGVVPPGGRHERDIHAVDLLDLVVVDLREDHLLLDPHRV